MAGLLFGILGFILYIVYEYYMCGRLKQGFFKSFFTLGCVCWALSALLCILKSRLVTQGTPGGPAWLLLSLFFIGLFLTIYALFIALPKEAYTKDSTVVNTGIYGLCRHPAFWPFALCCVSLSIFFGGKIMAAECIMLITLEFIYIVVQDIYFLPQYIKGYSEYRKTVPFIIPRIR